MARYRGPKRRLSRRERVNLMLKSDPSKENNAKRKDPPGPQNRRMRQLSEYGVQLREKQKVKRIYGLLEKQFRNYYAKASRMPGVTGENLLRLLETRLDNVVYRLGYGKTRAQARQFVSHRHVLVNGKRVNIPSYHVKVGDFISFTEKSAGKGFMMENIQNLKSDYLQPWLEVEPATKAGTVITLPLREHVEYPINEQLIVEFYSK